MRSGPEFEILLELFLFSFLSVLPVDARSAHFATAEIPLPILLTRNFGWGLSYCRCSQRSEKRLVRLLRSRTFSAVAHRA